MTNDESNPKSECRRQRATGALFGFPASGFFRISSFGFRHCAEPHVGCYRIMNDLKFAYRQLVKHPVFTAVAVLTLALGIMATTAMYSVIYAVVLDPFPYKDVDNLMSVKVWDPAQQGYRTGYSTDQFLEIAERSSIFEGVIAST